MGRIALAKEGTIDQSVALHFEVLLFLMGGIKRQRIADQAKRGQSKQRVRGHSKAENLPLFVVLQPSGC